MEPTVPDGGNPVRPHLPPHIDPSAAYVKAVTVNGVHAWAIHAADGTELAAMPNRDVAFAAVMQNGLEPFSVH